MVSVAPTPLLQAVHGRLARPHSARQIALAEFGRFSRFAHALTDLGSKSSRGIGAFVPGSLGRVHSVQALLLQPDYPGEVEAQLKKPVTERTGSVAA